MKLLYIANIGLPTERAHGSAIMRMCEAFAGEGVSLELFVPTRKRYIFEDPFPYYSVEPIFSIRRLFSFDTVKWGKIGFWVHISTFICSILFFIGLFYRRQFVIYSRDEVILFFLSFFPVKIFWESHIPKFSFFSRFVIRRSEGIVTISHGLKKFYFERGVPEDKILVSHSGVDVGQFAIIESRGDCRKKLFLPEDARIIAYSGKLKTMGRDKGVAAIVESFVEVQKRVPEAFLLLVGAYPSEISSLEERVHSCGVPSNRYKVVSHINQNEVPFFLRAADVLVMNYPAKEHYTLYMSPLKLFEYMASGRPIVAPDLPSIREILNENNAVLVEPDNPEQLAQGIEKLLQDPDLADRLSAQSFRDVQPYTWSKRAQGIINFMRKDVNQPT